MASLPCKYCDSSDGAEYYEDTHLFHCFVCEKTWKDQGEGGNTVPKEEFKDESWDIKQIHEIKTSIRSISPSTFKQYSYYKASDGSHVVNHYDETGNVVAQKFRYKDKTFSWKGSNKDSIPFGMGLWRSGGKRITITEGELDCLSIAEALGGKYPVISINGGAQSAKKELLKHMEFLNSYQEIVLWFDSDKAGQKAVVEVSALFPPGKVSTVQAGEYKDANEVLQKKGKAGVLKLYYETKLYTPAGIVNANEGGYESFMEDSTSDEVYKTPYTKLEVSKGAITTFVSGSGMGKSTIVREIGHHLLMDHKLTIGHVALE